MHPFSFTYAPQLPELLIELNYSLALTTYQAGKVVLIGPRDENNLVSLPRTFTKAMGMALKDDKMAIACKDEVVVLKGSTKLAEHYPNNPNTYDMLYQLLLKNSTGNTSI